MLNINIEKTESVSTTLFWAANISFPIEIND